MLTLWYDSMCCMCFGVAAVASSSMPRYTFIVKALSPRDGGWVRVHGHFDNAEDAWGFIVAIWPLIADSSDYVAVKVVRTIAF